MKKLVLMAVLIAAPVYAGAKAGSDWLTMTGRADSDISRDAGRKPVETLLFLGIKKGDIALDYISGGGYYAEIMARAVGPKGRVVAWNPQGFAASDQVKAKFAGYAARIPNLTHEIADFDKFDGAPNSFNFAMFHLVYHDLYWQSDEYKVPKTDPDAVLKRLYAAMRPGGIVGVVDHVGSAGDTRAVVDKTHRIDPAVVKADFARAGFRLVGESKLLRTADDDYAKNVFDPALRGKTDRFILKFKKP